MAEILQCWISGRPDQDHGEVPLLVQEDQHLVTVEVALPGERVGHGPRLRTVAQAVLPVDVGHAARPAHRRRCPEPVDAPPGPPGRVHDQVRLHRGAVHHDAVHSPLRPEDAVDVPVPDRETMHRLRRRAERSFERVAARPVPGRDRTHARYVEGHGFGAEGEPRVERRRPLAAERHSDLCPEAVRVVELHHARPRPVAGRGTGITVHRDDVVAAAGQRATEEQTGGTGSDDRNSHENASSRAHGAPTGASVFWGATPRQRN
jgi:hypothetical protein